MEDLPESLRQKYKKLLSASKFMDRTDVARFLCDLNPEDPRHQIVRDNVIQLFKKTCRFENRCSALPTHLTGKPPKKVRFELNEVKAVVKEISALLPSTRDYKHCDCSKMDESKISTDKKKNAGKTQEKENVEKQTQYEPDSKFDPLNKDRTNNSIKFESNYIPRPEYKTNWDRNNNSYCQAGTSKSCKCANVKPINENYNYEYMTHKVSNDDVTRTTATISQFEKIKTKNLGGHFCDKEFLKDVFLEDTTSSEENFLPLKFIGGLTTKHTNTKQYSTCPQNRTETKDIGIQVSVRGFATQTQSDLITSKCDKSTSNAVNEQQLPVISKKNTLDALYEYTDHLCNESINRLEEYCNCVHSKRKHSDKQPPSAPLHYKEPPPRLSHIPLHSNYKKVERENRFTNIPHNLTDRNNNEFVPKHNPSKCHTGYSPLEMKNEKQRTNKKFVKKTVMPREYPDYMRPQLHLCLDPNDTVSPQGRIPAISMLLPDPKVVSRLYKRMSYAQLKKMNRKHVTSLLYRKRRLRHKKGEKPRLGLLTVDPADTEEENYIKGVIYDFYPDEVSQESTETLTYQNMTKPCCKSAMKSRIRRKKSRHVTFYDENNF